MRNVKQIAKILLPIYLDENYCTIDQGICFLTLSAATADKITYEEMEKFDNFVYLWAYQQKLITKNQMKCGTGYCFLKGDREVRIQFLKYASGNLFAYISMYLKRM